MAYEPTVWKNRVVERPLTFNMVNNPDGTVTLVPAPGVIVESGTPVNAVNLNKLEQGLKTHEADNTSTHGGVLGRARYNGNIYDIVIGDDKLILENLFSTTRVVSMTKKCMDNSCIYTGAINGNVRRFDKYSMQLFDVNEQHAYGGEITGIDVDENYLYITGKTTAKIRKLDKSNLSSGVIAESPTSYQVNLLVDNDYVYSINGSVRKLSKSNLSLVASASTSIGSNNYAMAMDDEYLYVGNHDKLIKIRKSDMVEVASNLAPGVSVIYAIATDENYVYIGGNSGIRKLNKSDLTIVPLSPSSYTVKSIHVDGGFIYINGRYKLTKDLQELYRGALPLDTDALYDGMFFYHSLSDTSKTDVYVTRNIPKILGARRVL